MSDNYDGPQMAQKIMRQNAEIERLRATLKHQCELNDDATDEIEHLRSALATAERKLRDEQDCHTDTVTELTRMSGRLAEAKMLLRMAIANCDVTGYEGAAAWVSRRDTFLACQRCGGTGHKFSAFDDSHDCPDCANERQPDWEIQFWESQP